MDNNRYFALNRISVKTRSEFFDNQISEKFLTASELAEALNVSVHTIRKWRKQEKIPYRKLGRSLRFRVSEVLMKLKEKKSNEK